MGEENGSESQKIMSALEKAKDVSEAYSLWLDMEEGSEEDRIISLRMLELAETREDMLTISRTLEDGRLIDDLKFSFAVLEKAQQLKSAGKW